MNNIIDSDEYMNMLPPDRQAIVIKKPKIRPFASRLMQTLHETTEDFARIGLIDIQTMHEFDALCLPHIKTR
jgi:hypothetical protein